MQFDVTQTVRGLNKVISEMYGEKCTISEVLSLFGFSSEQTELLQTERGAEFLSDINSELAGSFRRYSNGDRLLTILYRRYGLFEHSAATLQEIGDSMGITRERVRQLEGKAIKRFKSVFPTDTNTNLFVASACRTLGIDEVKILSRNGKKRV